MGKRERLAQIKEELGPCVLAIALRPRENLKGDGVQLPRASTGPDLSQSDAELLQTEADI